VPDLLAHLSIPAGTGPAADRLRDLCADPALAALAGDESWRAPLALLQGILSRSTGAVELADVFCRQSRRRVEDRFRAVFDNDDVETYRVAQQVLRGEHGWLETGMVRTPEEG